MALVRGIAAEVALAHAEGMEALMVLIHIVTFTNNVTKNAI